MTFPHSREKTNLWRASEHAPRARTTVGTDGVLLELRLLHDEDEDTSRGQSACPCRAVAAPGYSWSRVRGLGYARGHKPHKVHRVLNKPPPPSSRVCIGHGRLSREHRAARDTETTRYRDRRTLSGL